MRTVPGIAWGVGLILCLGAIGQPIGAEPAGQDEDAGPTESITRFLDLSLSRQEEFRRRLSVEADPPAFLARQLADAGDEARLMCLALIRDQYGDESVVPAVEALLANKLADPDGGDPAIMAACCEILGRWPRWTPIPALLAALKDAREVADVEAAAPAPGGPARWAPRTSVWRQADMALRLVTGEWPLPEPELPGEPPIRPGSPRDREQQLAVEQAWAAWWKQTNLAPNVWPQLTVRWRSFVPPADEADARSAKASAALLWVRPTATAQYCWRTGSVARPDEPVWQWSDRRREDRELRFNALQADAVKTVAAAAPAAAIAGLTWAIQPPPGIAADWTGQLEVIPPDGRPVVVRLAPDAAGAVAPPNEVQEALALLLPLLAPER